MIYIYTSIIFIVFCIVLMIKNSKSTIFRFLVLMLVGWISSFMGLFVYLSRGNEYFYINDKYFNINLSFWQFLQRLNINPILSNRLINFGVLLFVFSLLCFAVSFNHLKVIGKKHLFLLAIIPIFQLFFYDPVLYKLMYRLLFSTKTPYSVFEKFYVFIDAIHRLTSIINGLYIIIAIFLILYHLAKNLKITFMKHYLIYISLSIISVALIHSIMFSWAPKILINVSLAANYYNFLPIVDLTISKLMTSIFQYLVIICFAIITLSLLRYNVLEYYNKQKNIHITRSINTANLGARIFSHAVKNQFVSIMAEVEALEQIHVDDASRYHLKKIYEISEETLQRINNLHKRFSNIQLDFKPLSLNIVVFDALNKIGPLPKHITLSQRIENDVPLCFIDLTHMTEVLVNLLHNAIESLVGQEEGIITISIKNEDPWSLLMVEDTGCGIDNEDIKNIYQPFFSTKSSSRNWGVGLSYCHQIVTAHDGKILVETKKDQGSTFKILLPKLIRSE